MTVSTHEYVKDVTHQETHPLQLKDRPDFESGKTSVRAVDLFCGSGGISLGLALAAKDAGHAFDVALAVDFDEVAADVYRENFPQAKVLTAGVQELFDGQLGAEPTNTEASTAHDAGHVDILVGGPPCQGHSDLNNHTRRDDPKNDLYLRMARAAEVLRPSIVMIENVPAVVHAKNNAVERTAEALEEMGYHVAQTVVRMEQLGVAQRRRRHILLATTDGLPAASECLSRALGAVRTVRDVRWAIGDLVELEADDTQFDRHPRSSPDNQRRMAWLLENDAFDLPDHLRPLCHQDGEHSYRSMYGRLSWDSPSQTITSGYGSIGQGRFMHPEQARALTPHEAARLQGFPDYFRFDNVERRSDLATIIGNAVPPALGQALFEELASRLSSAADDSPPAAELSA